jgi:hypothetical protein
MFDNLFGVRFEIVAGGAIVVVTAPKGSGARKRLRHYHAVLARRPPSRNRITFW